MPMDEYINYGNLKRKATGQNLYGFEECPENTYNPFVKPEQLTLDIAD
jgi:hypothetical protein